MTGAQTSFRRGFRKLIKHILSLILFYSGAWALFRRTRITFRGGSITILAYHGVNEGPFALNLFLDPKTFSAQLRFLRRHYSVIPLAEAETLLQSGHSLDQDFVVLTFDDGYKDNFLFAFPILSELGLPATIFLATEPIDTGFPPFVYALVLAIHTTKNTSLDLSRRGLGTYSLADSTSRDAAITDLDQRARLMSADDRHALLGEILFQLDLTHENAIFHEKMLSWEEIQHMRRSGIAFGAHTVTHPVLARLEPAEIHREVSESKHKIEQQLRERITSFAYPYGTRAEVNPTAVDVVRECGFSSAVVLYNGSGNSSDLYTLGRKMVSEEMTSGVFRPFSRAVFACEMFGFFDFLLRRNHRAGYVVNTR